MGRGEIEERGSSKEKRNENSKYIGIERMGIERMNSGSKSTGA